MGYRSEAAIALHKNTEVRLRLSDKKEVVDLLDETPHKTEHEYSTTYFYSGYKWYSTYSGVAAMEDYLDTLEDEEFGFIRIGEESGDIETKGSPYEYGIDIVQEIVENDWYDVPKQLEEEADE